MSAWFEGEQESNKDYLKRMFKKYGLKGLLEGLWYLWRMRKFNYDN